MAGKSHHEMMAWMNKCRVEVQEPHELTRAEKMQQLISRRRETAGDVFIPSVEVYVEGKLWNPSINIQVEPTNRTEP